MHLQQVEGFGLDAGDAQKPSEKCPLSSALVVFPSPALTFFTMACL
jgi:hypothetical protein